MVLFWADNYALNSQTNDGTWFKIVHKCCVSLSASKQHEVLKKMAKKNIGDIGELVRHRIGRKSRCTPSVHSRICALREQGARESRSENNLEKKMV